MAAVVYGPPIACRWNAASGQICGEDESHLRLEDYFPISLPDGRPVGSAFRSGKLTLVDWVSGKHRATIAHDQRIPYRDGPTPFGAFAPDGRRFACVAVAKSGEEGHITQWDLARGRELPRLATVNMLGLPTGYSVDGRFVSAVIVQSSMQGPVAEVHCWEVATAKECLRAEQPVDSGRACTLSPDGRRLAMSSGHGTVAIWDVVTAKQLGVLDGHRGAVMALRFAPDGKTLCSAGEASVLIWGHDPAHAEARAAWLARSPMGRPGTA